jgi:hypothetical protein
MVAGYSADFSAQRAEQLPDEQSDMHLRACESSSEYDTHVARS